MIVVVIVFIALLPPAISLVRKRGRQINDVPNGKRVAAALKYFAGVGASPATEEEEEGLLPPELPEVPAYKK